MSWSDSDYGFAEAFEEDRRKSLRAAARHYLGINGDAVDRRVARCLAEAEALLERGHPGAALSITATAMELMIRFMIVRPLLHGAFLFDEWADVLVDRVIRGRVADDRAILPDLLRQVGIEIEELRLSAGLPTWEFLRGRFWPDRDKLVHRGDFPTTETARIGLECARLFRANVVGRLAKILDFTLEETGKWSEIRGTKEVGIGMTRILNSTFEPHDPLAAGSDSASTPTRG